MRCRLLKKAAVGVFLAVMSLSICSCGTEKEAKSPEATMEAFYQLIVYQDTGAIVKLGIDQKDAQETLDEYQSSMISAIQNQFKNAGISISKSESSDILDVITDSFQKLDYKVSLKKRDGKEASVTVSSQYIHYLDLFQQAADETINELKPKHIENLSDAKKLLIENIKTSFQNAEISKDMHSKTFDLKNKKIKSGKHSVRLFFPEDAEETGSKLMELVSDK